MSVVCNIRLSESFNINVTIQTIYNNLIKSNLNSCVVDQKVINFLEYNTVERLNI